jgi:hypothetical protein
MKVCSAWKPDLLFNDPPGLKSNKNPCFPALQSLLQGAEDIANVLMWLPMSTAGNKGDGLMPLSATTIDTWLQCGNADFEIAAVRWSDSGPLCGCLVVYRWSDSGPLCGCLVVYRFDSPTVVHRVNAAVVEVVEAMGEGWRLA